MQNRPNYVFIYLFIIVTNKLYQTYCWCIWSWPICSWCVSAACMTRAHHVTSRTTNHTAEGASTDCTTRPLLCHWTESSSPHLRTYSTCADWCTIVTLGSMEYMVWHHSLRLLVQCIHSQGTQWSRGWFDMTVGCHMQICLTHPGLLCQQWKQISLKGKITVTVHKIYLITSKLILGMEILNNLLSVI